MAKPNLELPVDVVDAGNNVIGRSLRREIFDKGYGFRTVHVFVFDHNDDLLIQHLHHDHPRSPNKLGSSVAGYVSAGETYRAAAIRKIKDELGVDAELARVGVFRMKDLTSNKFVGLFIARLAETKLQVDTETIKAIVPMDVNSLDDLVQSQPTKFTSTFLRVYEAFRSAES